MSAYTVITDYTRFWFLNGALLRLNTIINLSVVAGFGVYFFNSLNMAEKIFTFIISGKVVGSSYILQLRDVYIISALVVGTMLVRSFYVYFKFERNQGKIKLNIRDSAPFELSVKIA